MHGRQAKAQASVDVVQHTVQYAYQLKPQSIAMEIRLELSIFMLYGRRQRSLHTLCLRLETSQQ